MDLISIKRKYRNIRNTIISLALIFSLLLIILVLNEVYKKTLIEKTSIQYAKQIERIQEIAIKLEQERLEEERKAKLPELTEEGKQNIQNIYKSETKRVFLTFDDGPSKNVTVSILDILKQENVKATFFVLGSRVELYPDIVKREYDEGHFIASHGYSHIYSQIYASPQSVLDEYNKSLVAIRNAIGEQEYNPHLFRFPGGYAGGKYALIKQEAATVLEQNGIMHVDWNALTSDAAGSTTTEQFLTELDRTVKQHTSVVVLMHDAGTKQATADALPQIIAYFRDRGFEFKNFYDVFK